MKQPMTVTNSSCCVVLSDALSFSRCVSHTLPNTAYEQHSAKKTATIDYGGNFQWERLFTDGIWQESVLSSSTVLDVLLNFKSTRATVIVFSPLISLCLASLLLSVQPLHVEVMYHIII